MNAFRCYFLSESSHIRGALDFSALTVEAAIQLGFTALGDYNRASIRPASAIEIWSGAQLVFAGKPDGKGSGC